MAMFVAPLDGNRRSPAPFGPWWTTPILTDHEGNAFGRGDLILKVANKEGGAHSTRSFPSRMRPWPAGTLLASPSVMGRAAHSQREPQSLPTCDRLAGSFRRRSRRR